MHWWHSQGKEKIFKHNYEISLIKRDRKDLYKRSDSRFLQMIDQGAVEEAKNIMRRKKYCGV